MASLPFQTNRIKQGSRWLENATQRVFEVLMDEDAEGVAASVTDIFKHGADIWFSSGEEFRANFTIIPKCQGG